MQSKRRGKHRDTKEAKQLSEQHCRSQCKPAPIHPPQAFQTRPQPTMETCSSQRQVSHNVQQLSCLLQSLETIWITLNSCSGGVICEEHGSISKHSSATYEVHKKEEASEGSQAVLYWLPEDRYRFAYNPGKLFLYFLKSRNYKQENSFLINNLTPFLRQKGLAWNIISFYSFISIVH